MSTSSACGDPRDIWPNGFPDKFDTSTFNVGAGMTMSSSASWSNIELDLPSDKHFKELTKRMMCIETQLMILNPDFDLHEKYPALKEAYDAYQVILKLVKDNAKVHE